MIAVNLIDRRAGAFNRAQSPAGHDEMFNFKPIDSNMNDEQLFQLPEEVLRKLKTLKDYDDYFQKLYKQGIEAMLKAEMGEHLGYPKNDPAGKKSGNSRNGYSVSIR